ncbi:MAG: pitrilysin family protein [Elusimicrobiota bacterium]
MLHVESFVLPNGLQVVVQSDHTSPVVAVSITYKVGSQHETPGLSGFAHLFEHLMAQGTKSLKPREISQLIESNGGVRNAYTMKTNTTYHSLIPRSALKTVLWAEAERMHTLNVDARALALEQQVVLEEMRLRYLNAPYAKAQDAGVSETAFTKWQNQHTTIGEMRDVQGASLADVRAFYQTHYAPNNAVLALAGDVTLAEARGLVPAYFGAICARVVPAAPDLAEPAIDGERRRVISDPLAKLPRLMVGWHGPARGTKDFWSLRLLAEILSSGEASPLYQALVKDAKVALGVSVTMPWWSDHYNAHGPDLFGFILPLKLGKTAEEALAKVDEVLARFAREGPSEGELAAAKTQSELEWLGSMQSLVDRAKILSSYAALIGDPKGLSRDLDDLLRVTEADIREALSRWIIGRGRAVVHVVPGTPAPAEAEAPAPEAPAETPRPAGETAPAGEPAKPVPIPSLSRFTLANGLKVILLKDDRLPLVEARLSLKAGRTAEDPGEEALASAAASLLLKGAGAEDGAAVTRGFLKLGYGLEIEPGTENLNLSAQGLARNAEAFFRRLALVLSQASYPEAELALWKENTLQRLKDLRNNPRFLSSEKLNEELFGAHPYGRGVPTEAQLAKMSSDGLREFHRRRVVPDGAALVLAGPLEPREAQALLERALAGWQGSAQTAKTPGMPAQGPSRLARVDRPGSTQVNLTLAQTVALKPKDPDYPAFVVMNQLLGGSATSRLFLNLRVDKGYTYGAYSRAAAFDQGMVWTAEAETRAEVAWKARDEILEEIDRIREVPVTAQVLGAVKRYLAGLFLIRLASCDLTADYVARLERDGKDAETELAAYLDRLEALTPEDIRRAARKHLDPGKMVQILVGDAGRIDAALAGPAKQLQGKSQ